MANLIKKQDQCASAQGSAKELNVAGNYTFTTFEAVIPLKTPILSFVPLSIKNSFTKFMKVIMGQI